MADLTASRKMLLIVVSQLVLLSGSSARYCGISGQSRSIRDHLRLAGHLAVSGRVHIRDVVVDGIPW